MRVTGAMNAVMDDWEKKYGPLPEDRLAIAYLAYDLKGAVDQENMVDRMAQRDYNTKGGRRDNENAGRRSVCPAT